MSGRAAGETVHHVGYLTGGAKRLHNANDLVGNGDLSLLRGSAHVVGSEHTRSLGDGADELAGAAGGLVLEHIEPGSDSPLTHGLL